MNERTSFRVIDERGGLRCPYCHGDVLQEEAQEACQACRATHHQECWDAHGGCSSCGVVREQPAPARGAEPQHFEQARRRRQATRLGGNGLLRYEHGEDDTVLEWGSNMDDARLRIIIQAIFVLSATVVPGLGLIAGPGWAIGLLVLAFFFGLYLGIPITVYHLLELRKSGRLTIDNAGFRLDRLGYMGRYVTTRSVPWSEIAELGWWGSKANRNYEVYAETAQGRITLARFRFEEHARQFIGHFQRSRARLATEVDPSLIRVQPRSNDIKEM